MLAQSSSADLAVQFPHSVLACSGELLAPRRVVALWARARAFSLDQRLAAGDDPRDGNLLAARARQLARPATRAGIAAGLERLALTDRRSDLSFAIEPHRDAITINQAGMLELAQALRSPRPAYAGGIAAARLILVDGAGPAYCDRRGEALARALQSAQRRLHG